MLSYAISSRLGVHEGLDSFFKSSIVYSEMALQRLKSGPMVRPGCKILGYLLCSGCLSLSRHLYRILKFRDPFTIKGYLRTPSIIVLVYCGLQSGKFILMADYLWP